MDNNAFQNALDKCFDKFHSFVRSTSAVERAGLAATAGLMATTYILATTPSSEFPYYLADEGWQYTKDLFSFTAVPLATAALATYSKISLTNNSLAWLDDANGYKAPEVEAVDPAKFVGPVKPVGFFKRHIESAKNVVDKSVAAYERWGDTGFKGAIKRNLEDFKVGLRAVSMEDASAYGVSVVVAATVFDSVIMNGLGAPITNLLESGGVNYTLEALHSFTEIFNKNILMSAQGLATLAGVKAGLIGWDNSRVAKKAATQKQDGDDPSGPEKGANNSVARVSDPVVVASDAAEIEPQPKSSHADAIASFFNSDGFHVAGSKQDANSSLDQVKGHDKSMGM